MTWDWGNTAIVALLVAAWMLLDWADRRDLLAIGLHRLRIRLSRRVPVGRYRFDGGISVGFGHPDTVIIFKLPLQAPGSDRPVKHVAVTDESTRFSVGGATVTLDEFLEAYDAELGPIEVQVLEKGRVAEIGIDPVERPERDGG